jgi:methyl-accepting chemotaxis protein
MQDDVFRWVISIAVFLALLASVVQVVLLFAIYRLCKAAQNRLLPLMDVITPFIGRTHLFMNESALRFSQIATVTSHTGQAVESLVENVNHLAEATKDLTERARASVARIEGAIDQTLEQVNQAGDVMKQAIHAPAKHVEGITNGIRAALSVVVHRERE